MGYQRTTMPNSMHEADQADKARKPSHTCVSRRSEALTPRLVRPRAGLRTATGPLLHALHISGVGIVRIGIEKLLTSDFVTGNRNLAL